MSFLVGILGGGKPKITAPTAVSALQLQSSMQGQPIPLIYGTTRVAANLIWYGNFKSHPQQAQRSGGKGGGVTGGGKGGQSGTSGYTYTTAVAMALCEGPISSVGTVYVNKDQSTLSTLGLTLFTGSYSQSPWSYLTTNYSSQALNYHGIAYLAASDYNLGTNPQLPNHNFEVRGVYSSSLSSLGKVDADPSLVITDFLTNTHYGAAFPSSRVANYSSYQGYAIANGLWVSPAYNSQSQASTMLDDIVTATNSAFVWSEGVLNIVPYGDQTISANGYTYNAPSSALYALTYDDFLQTSNVDPVKITRKRPADQINSIKIECLNRDNSYNPAIIEAKDQGLIDTFGLRQAPSKQAHIFCDLSAGQLSASLQLLRQGIRNVYSFTLDQRYVLLDPMDIVSITDSNLGLSSVFVRILEISENEDRSLDFIAEEYIQGLGNTPLYNFQNTSSGFVPSTTCPPGTTFPVIVDAPQCLDPNAPAVWVAAGGPGGAFNAQKGTVTFWYNAIGQRSVATPSSGHDILNTIFNATQFAGAQNTLNISTVWKRFSSGVLSYVYRASIQTYVYPDIINNTSGKYLCFLQFNSATYSSVPATPVAVGVTWDGSGTTWTGKIFVNGADVTDYSSQASSSFVRNTQTSSVTSGTTMGVPLDGAHIFQSQQTSDSYVIQCGVSSGNKFELSQLWMLCDNAIDFTVSSNWAKFFDASNAPVNLGTDGTLPTGRRPLIYLPYGTSSLGTNTGILGNISTSSGGSITNASSIPASGSYQALGLNFGSGATISSVSPLPVVNPELNACDVWGSCNVYVSTDGGTSYTLSGVVESPSPVGQLTAAFSSGTDPDTIHTLSVDLGQSQQSLSSFTKADADNFIPICALYNLVNQVYEFVDYETATLTSSYRYDLTYIRRGVYYSGINSWTAYRSAFARLGPNVLKIPYSSNLVGQWMFFKMQALNPVGGGAQDLSVLQTFAYQLQGPQGIISPASIGATETSSVVTLTWPPGSGCSLSGYDVGIYKNADYSSGNGNFGTITFWLDPQNISSVGTGIIYSHIASSTSSFNHGSQIILYYNQTASSGAAAGKYVIAHSVSTRQSSSNFSLITPTTQQNISSGPIAVGISYDGTASSAWTGKILINGVDVTDTSSQSALSFHGASSGTAMGVVMDGTQVWDEFNNASWMGVSTTIFASANNVSSVSSTNVAFGLSNLWIAPGHTLDLTSSGNWALFFDSNNQPKNIGAQGELPVSSVPWAYYPTYSNEPGHSAGQSATLDYTIGVITNDTLHTSGPVAPGIMITTSSALGFLGDVTPYGYLLRNQNTLTTTVSGLVPATYTFQVRSVDSLGFTGNWTTSSFTVT